MKVKCENCGSDMEVSEQDVLTVEEKESDTIGEIECPMGRCLFVGE